MIRNTRQNWQVGATVKVGFLSLRVLDVAAVKDWLPDLYLLESLDSTKLYRFIPHNGLVRLERKEGWQDIHY